MSSTKAETLCYRRIHFFMSEFYIFKGKTMPKVLIILTGKMVDHDTKPDNVSV